MNRQASRPENIRGMALMVLAMAGFAAEDALIKVMARTLSTGQILIFIGLGGAFVLWLWARAKGVRLTGPDFLDQMFLTRCAAEMLGTAGFVTGLALAPISLVSAIIQAAPLFVTIGAVVLLGERVGPRRWSAVLVGLAGMMLILQPWADGLTTGALAALFGTFMLSLRDVVTRRLPATLDSRAAAAYGFLSVIPAGLLLLVLTPGWGEIGQTEAVLLASSVVVGIIAYLSITLSLRLGEASAVAPFRYSRLAFGMAIGILIFDETIDPLMISGAAIVIGTGLYVFWREARGHPGN